MPGLNQTGPLGQGSMTGRKMGVCTNYGANRAGRIAKSDQSDNRIFKRFRGRNQDPDNIDRGPGRGRGRGWGRGMGAGNRFGRNF